MRSHIVIGMGVLSSWRQRVHTFCPPVVTVDHGEVRSRLIIVFRIAIGTELV